MIKAQYKLLLGLLPFVAAAGLASAAVYPAYLEDQGKHADVVDQKRQNDALLTKLRDRQQAEKERTNLENDISNLRGAVPKTPELDLFMLDLERMCADSGVDLIGVESPEAETLRNLDASEEDMKEVMDITAAKPAAPKPPPNKATTPAATQPEKNPIALKQLIKQVYVTSDYDGLVRLMHKLETYQRVTGVKQVTVAMPGDGNEGGENLTSVERAKKLGLHQPVMSFIMTLYYLP